MHAQAAPSSPATQPPLLSAAAGNMLLAAFAFSIMNIFVKQLDRIPVMEIVFVRCLVSALFCGVGLWRIGVDWKGHSHALLLARGTFGTIALFAFFLTIQHMPLATAVTIQYLSPIFTALIGVFVFGEHVRPLQWLFYGIAFTGVFVIKGFDSSVSLFYLLVGIVSALCASVAYNLVRRLREQEHPLVVVLHFQLVGVVVGLVVCFWQWRMPTAWEWFSLFMCGVLTQIAQVHLTKALQAEQVARISILNYTGLLYAFAFGTLLFGERYSGQALGGMLLVVLGVLMSVLYSRRKRVIPAGAPA